jgi:hypothetical protein
LVRAKSGSPDGKLMPHRVYTRRPGPTSEEPRTAEEWDRLFERVLQNRKAELLEAMRSIMAGVIPGNVYFIPTDLSLSGREVEQRYLDTLREVRKATAVPVAIKLGPYFSAMGHMATQFAGAGADALVLFNRFYQPDIDLVELRLLNDLRLSTPEEMRLPLLWIAVLSGRIEASLAASTGVETSDQVIKYLLAGADVVMTTSALLRHGVRYVEELLAGIRSWLAARDIESVAQIRGLLSQRNVRNPDSLGRANYMKIRQGYSTLQPEGFPPYQRAEAIKRACCRRNPDIDRAKLRGRSLDDFEVVMEPILSCADSTGSAYQCPCHDRRARNSARARRGDSGMRAAG